LIPHELIHNETVPEGPDGDIAAVEELTPGAAAPGRTLKITANDILTRKLFTLGSIPRSCRCSSTRWRQTRRE